MHLQCPNGKRARVRDCKLDRVSDVALPFSCYATVRRLPEIPESL